MTTTTDLLDRIPTHMTVCFAPLEDGDASISSVYVTDKAQSGYVPLLVIPHTYADNTGHNETVCLANRQWIEDNWVGEDTGDHLIEITYAFAGTEYALRMDTLPELGEVEAEDVVDAVVDLYEYPLFDDSYVSDVEHRLIEEAFTSYLVSDTKRELAADVRDHADYCDDDDVAAALRDAVEEVGAYPYVEGESVYFGSYELTDIVPAWERRIKELKDLDGNAFTPAQD